MNRPEQLHPLVASSLTALEAGRISRREFLRLATLVGASFTTASLLAGCTTPIEEASVVAVTTPQRGGTLRMGGPVARFGFQNLGDYVSDNLWRCLYEHLTWIDHENITHPNLLEKWAASADLNVWTLYLRQNVKWSNGDDFVAEDVVRSLRRRHLYRNAVTGTGPRFEIEAPDDHTVALHLSEPALDVPEQLFTDGAIITHRDHDGLIDFEDTHVTTGPFTVSQLELNKRVVLKRRENYWRLGADDLPLPYLATIERIDLGYDTEPYLAALQAGTIDAYAPNAVGYTTFKENPAFTTLSVPSAETCVLRFAVNRPPWRDNRVRRAVKKLQNRQRILDRAVLGLGVLGQDTHVAPIHREYSPMAAPDFDPEGAVTLLKEAGQENLSFTINVNEEIQEIVTYAEVLQEDARAAGVDITVAKMPSEQYWNSWMTASVGITPWRHRPLAVTVLQLAYTADDAGNLSVWNESGWADAEFSALLAQAQATLDVDARRAIMADLQRIQRDRGSIGVAFWMDRWLVVNRAFHNVQVHPNKLIQYSDAWYEPNLDPGLSEASAP